ncbi:MAG TPA: ABC transporter permease [Bacillota bacterium]|nr:ABC transporter permease [Bacillota bacterium]
MKRHDIARSAGSPKFRVSGVLIAIIAVVGVFSFTARGFFSLANFANIALQGSVLFIASLGMTLAILSGMIDLSIGGVMTLSGVVTALALKAGLPLPIAVLAGLAAGSLCGAFTGYLVSSWGFHHWIATFGMMGISQGIALVITQGASVSGFSRAFRNIGDSTLLSVPVPVLIAAATFAVIAFVLYRTRFGSNMYAIGGSEQVARYSGINSGRMKLAVFVLTGFLAAIAGIVLTSRMNSANPTAGMGYEFDSIAAVIIGGTPITGGRGGVKGTFLGAFIISVLKNGLNLVGLSSPWQLTIIGAMITGAIIVDVITHSKR